jgi:cytochrome P450
MFRLYHRDGEPRGEGMTTIPAIGDHFDPMSPELGADFWATITSIQRTCPVLRSEAYGGYWLLTRYADVWNVVRDWESFTSTEGVAGIPINKSEFRFIPIEVDPPYHRSVRKLLNPYFAPQVMPGYEPAIRRIAAGLIDRFRAAGRCEFVEDFAQRFPAQVFFEVILDLPTTELQRVEPWLHAIIWEPNTAGPAVADFGAWTKEVFDRRRREPRRDDVLDAMLFGEIDGRAVTDHERACMLTVLIIGGIETGATAYANLAYQLATRSDIAELLRRDPTARANAPDEFLRFEAPALGLARSATRDLEIGGHHIRKGDRVLCYYGAANRDPEEFPEPETLDFTRPGNRHLSFGAGPHRCIGSHLARLEFAVVLDELLSLPGLRLGTDEEIEYRVGLHRAPAALPLAFTPGRSTSV